MTIHPSLITRIGIGKLIGLIFGLAGFFLLPFLSPESDPLLRWGVLFWYITVGAVIGIFGVITWHPILHLPLPWWFRAPLIGGWMNFVLTFFAYDALQSIIVSIFGSDFYATPPFWFVLEGAVIGLIIGFFVTLFGGEGKAIVPGAPSEGGF